MNARSSEKTDGRRRNVRSEATRTRLLDTAETLYAEQGMGHVSNRTIVELAGEANKTALNYHFGAGDGLLRALLERHSADIAERCDERLAALPADAGLRGPVSALILAVTGHLASLRSPTWSARLFAQFEVDPRARSVARSMDRPAPMEAAVKAILAVVPGPAEVAALRLDAARIMVIGMCAEREAAAARAGVPVDWPLVGDVLTDLVTAMLTAPTHQA